jgi:hypothetical protein
MQRRLAQLSGIGLHSSVQLLGFCDVERPRKAAVDTAV